MMAQQAQSDVLVRLEHTDPLAQLVRLAYLDLLGQLVREVK